VWVIDTKRYKSKVAVRQPLFGRVKLIVAGRDKAKLVEGLAQQTGAVRVIVEQVAPEAPAHGAFCFVDADLPLLSRCVSADSPYWRRRAVARPLNKSGPLPTVHARRLAGQLAARFPSA
jgi:hypothetical protein